MNKKKKNQKQTVSLCMHMHSSNWFTALVSDVAPGLPFYCSVYFDS